MANQTNQNNETNQQEEKREVLTEEQALNLTAEITKKLLRYTTAERRHVLTCVATQLGVANSGQQRQQQQQRTQQGRRG